MTESAQLPTIVGAKAETALIRCGADLVELAEGLWLRLFRAGLIAVVLAGPLCSLLAVVDARSVRDGMTAGLGALVSTLAAIALTRACAVYRALRRSRLGQLAPGLLGAALVTVHGPYAPLWFQTLALIAVTAVLSDTRATLFVAALATAGYIAGTLAHGAPLAPGETNRYLAEALSILPNALLDRIVIEGLAGFTLRVRTFEQPQPFVPRPLRVPNRAAAVQSSRAGPEVRRQRRAPGRLTARQLEVVVLLRDGLHQYEIAECLSISARQVERLVTQARERVGARNTHELVALAVREGLVPQPR